jgi:hypothetical protein
MAGLPQSTKLAVPKRREYTAIPAVANPTKLNNYSVLSEIASIIPDPAIWKLPDEPHTKTGISKSISRALPHETKAQSKQSPELLDCSRIAALESHLDQYVAQTHEVAQTWGLRIFSRSENYWMIWARKRSSIVEDQRAVAVLAKMFKKMQNHLPQVCMVSPAASARNVHAWFP